MSEMMRKVWNSKSVFSMELTIPRLPFADITDDIFYRSSEYEFCDGHWSLVISRGTDTIRCSFVKAYGFVAHLKGVTVRKSIQINGGDIEFHLPENYFTAIGSINDYEESKFNWKLPGPKDCLKITCVITCHQFHRKFDCKDFLTQWILPMCGDKFREVVMGLHASGEDSDVIIKVKDQEFRTQKSILRAMSPVFYSMFRYNMTENNTGTIHITDCDPAAFRKFLAYLCSGKMNNVSEDIVFSLYYIGDKYEVEEVKKICVKYMSKYLSVETFFETVALGLLHNDPAVLEAAAKFFVENRRKITSTDQWISFLREHPVTGNDLYILAVVFHAQCFNRHFIM